MAAKKQRPSEPDLSHLPTRKVDAVSSLAAEMMLSNVDDGAIDVDLRAGDTGRYADNAAMEAARLIEVGGASTTPQQPPYGSQPSYPSHPSHPSNASHPSYPPQASQPSYASYPPPAVSPSQRPPPGSIRPGPVYAPYTPPPQKTRGAGMVVLIVLVLVAVMVGAAVASNR